MYFLVKIVLAAISIVLFGPLLLSLATGLATLVLAAVAAPFIWLSNLISPTSASNQPRHTPLSENDAQWERVWAAHDRATRDGTFDRMRIEMEEDQDGTYARLRAQLPSPAFVARRASQRFLSPSLRQPGIFSGGYASNRGFLPLQQSRATTDYRPSFSSAQVHDEQPTLFTRLTRRFGW